MFVEKLDLVDLPKFSYTKSYLSIVERKAPETANNFFKKFITKPFSIDGHVHKKNSLKDVQGILKKINPIKLEDNSFYKNWVIDMAKVCKIFCHTMKSSVISFSLETQRGCRRYHIDNVPFRMLVTYYGQGTEWLPYEAADYEAYHSGAKNKEIVKDLEARKFINSWDIAVFRGGTKGILHRTPDQALNRTSILMRLDHSTYLKDLKEYNK